MKFLFFSFFFKFVQKKKIKFPNDSLPHSFLSAQEAQGPWLEQQGRSVPLCGTDGRLVDFLGKNVEEF